MTKRTELFQILLGTILGAAILTTFFVKEIEVKDFFGTINLVRMLAYVLFVALLLFVFRSAPKIDLKSHKLPVWAKRLIIILPIVAVAFALINAALPEVSWIVRVNDDNIFQRPGAYMRMVFQLISCGIFISLIVPFVKRKKWLSVGVLTFLALVLFVMAMEEISWGQRIFQWQTTGYFSAHNVQNETNLHNLATQLFQNALFFGGFILLVVLPFFHDNLERLLRKIKSISPLTDFLPEPWMILAFGAGLVFVDPFNAMYGLHWGSICFQVIATLMLLVALVYRVSKSDVALQHAAMLTLAAAIIVVAFSLSFNRLWLLNQGLPTEYIKLYISFGIFCWALRVRERVVPAASV